MFGLYRFLLAIAVVFSHLFGVPILGWLAVQGFFILSGYLMTSVMQRRYGYHMGGVGRFALNRFLRLFPTYWIILVACSIILAVFGAELSTLFQSQMALPDTVSAWSQNLSMMFMSAFPGEVTPIISPPAWTLTVELFFYGAIALGATRTRATTATFFALSVLYFGVTHIMGLDIQWRYGMILAGGLPFALGGMIYHFSEKLSALQTWLARSAHMTWLCVGLIWNAIMCLIATDGSPGLFLNLTFYINLALSAALILALAGKQQPSSGWPARLGDYSYPIYLMHYPVAFAVSMVLWDRATPIIDSRTIVTFVVTVAICLIASTLIVNLIDNPIQTLCQRVRGAGPQHPRVE